MEYKNILVTGGSGLIGNHLKEFLPTARYLSSKDYDLTKEDDVIKLFMDNKPDVVIHLAARVGGILDNINNPVEYLEENVLMNTLILKYSHKFKLKKLITTLSTCIYPDNSSTYPMKEYQLYEGVPAITNLNYALSKRMMGIHIDSYNKEYYHNWNYIIPCNLMGKWDKFNETGHFVGSLINKILLAKINKCKKITLMGDGTPLRQFIYAQDVAYIISEIVKRDINISFNVATDENLSINEITNIVLEACDATDIKIEYDKTKPNGQYRKDVDISIMKQIFPDFKTTPIKNAISEIYKFLKN